MQKLCNVYEALNKDGEVVARGFSTDVAMVIGCSPQNIVSLGKYEGTYDGKYKIRIIGRKVKYYNKEGEVTGYSAMLPKQETFVERYRDLDYHGNTIMTKEEFKRHKYLIEDKGYRVKYTKKKHGRQKMYYLVEVI